MGSKKDNGMKNVEGALPIGTFSKINFFFNFIETKPDIKRNLFKCGND